MSWFRLILPFVLLIALVLPRAECVRCERGGEEGGATSCCAQLDPRCSEPAAELDDCCSSAAPPSRSCTGDDCCEATVCIFPFSQCPGDPQSPCRCIFSLLDELTAIPLAKTGTVGKSGLVPHFLAWAAPFSNNEGIATSNIERRWGRSPPPIPISSRTRRASICVRTI
jgi:hypothetical protein